MQVFNMQFPFRGRSRIVHVYFTGSTQSYLIYFTDVELILEFGCKANYSTKDGLRFLKQSSEAESLKAVLTKQLQAIDTVAA